MKIGVVGLGFMGGTHLEAYQQIPEAEIVAVASGDEKKLAGDLTSTGGNLDRGGRQMDFGDAARYHTAEELISDPRVEAVDLCTPSDLHAEQAIRALEAGKHVLVEKPMAISARDCERMLEARDRAGKVLMVAQVLRFLPDYVAAREKIRSGEVGRVLQAFFYRKCGAPAWSRWLPDRKRSGGGVFDLLIHDFDFCQHLFGEPDSIDATGVDAMEQGIDTLEARLGYVDGPQVTVAGGWRHPKAYPFSMEFTIVCEGGTLDYDSRLRPLTLFGEDGEEHAVPRPDKDGFQAELKAFVDACRLGEAPPNCRPEDSAAAVRMALTARDGRHQ